MMEKRNYCTLFVFCLILVFSGNLWSQDKGPRKSLKASVSQTIGTDTDIKIIYSRPGVNGRAIWGELVPYGMHKGN
jgi:hypothetical protein